MSEYYAFPLNTTTQIGAPQTWNDGWSFDALKKLSLQLEQLEKGRGQIGTGAAGEELADWRSSSVAWVPIDADHRWIYDVAAHQVKELNATRFGLDLFGVHQLQYSVYEGAAENGEHYDWHVDVLGPGYNQQRKLSYVLQLSDPEEYEGGDLMFRGVWKGVALKQKGLVYVFPSYVEHRVTPVTKGVRRTLVGWVTGPQFR